MSVLFGYYKGQRVNIYQFTDEMKGNITSALDKPLIAKRGSKQKHHFAHKFEGDKDPWLEGMCDWHRYWQGLCEDYALEVVMDGGIIKQYHIADIVANNRVIELQHSPISQEDIIERETFYGDMIWVFDFTNHVDRMTVVWVINNYCCLQFTKSFYTTNKPCYLDLGNIMIQLISVNGKRYYGKFIDRKKFVHVVLGSVLKDKDVKINSVGFRTFIETANNVLISIYDTDNISIVVTSNSKRLIISGKTWDHKKVIAGAGFQWVKPNWELILATDDKSVMVKTILQNFYDVLMKDIE